MGRATPSTWRKGPVSDMRIGILGSGLMGGKLGTLFARAGHEVVFSYARSEQKLKTLARKAQGSARAGTPGDAARSEEHTSELQSQSNLVCRLLLEKKNKQIDPSRRT